VPCRLFIIVCIVCLPLSKHRASQFTPVPPIFLREHFRALLNRWQVWLNRRREPGSRSAVCPAHFSSSAARRCKQQHTRPLNHNTTALARRFLGITTQQRYRHYKHYELIINSFVRLLNNDFQQLYVTDCYWQRSGVPSAVSARWRLFFGTGSEKYSILILSRLFTAAKFQRVFRPIIATPMFLWQRQVRLARHWNIPFWQLVRIWAIGRRLARS